MDRSDAEKAHHSRNGNIAHEAGPARKGPSRNILLPTKPPDLRVRTGTSKVSCVSELYLASFAKQKYASSRAQAKRSSMSNKAGSPRHWRSSRWRPQTPGPPCLPQRREQLPHTAILRCRTGAPAVRPSAASIIALASMPWWRYRSSIVPVWPKCSTPSASRR